MAAPLGLAYVVWCLCRFFLLSHDLLRRVAQAVRCWYKAARVATVLSVWCRATGSSTTVRQCPAPVTASLQSTSARSSSRFRHALVTESPVGCGYQTPCRRDCDDGCPGCESGRYNRGSQRTCDYSWWPTSTPEGFHISHISNDGHSYSTKSPANCTYNSVDELARALLSYKRPTRPRRMRQ